MRDNYFDLIKPFFERTVMTNYKFGFTGEAYISEGDFELEYIKYKDILSKYFSLKKPYYCNRNELYYSTNLFTTIDLVKSISSDALKLINSNLPYKIKQFILFSLTGHMFSCTAKILGITFAYTSLKDSYYEVLKKCILEYCIYMVRLIFNEDFRDFPILPDDLINSIERDMISLNISQVREYSEMDNILILFITYFVLYDYIGDHNIIISPLQGAALIPPFFIAMQKYTSSMNPDYITKSFDYVRYSRYDNSHYFQTTLQEQVQALNGKYRKVDKVMLIDDNTGTALTLKNIKEELNKYFRDISTCALEYYWEGKIFMSETYPAFQFSDIDYISPLCYRHFRIFDEHIPYIKNNKNIHKLYENGEFYNLKYIFNEFNFYSFINEYCEDEHKRNIIFELCSRFKTIDDLFNKL